MYELITMTSTTAKHFAVFKKECLRMIDVLGLRDWHIRIERGEVDGERRFEETTTEATASVTAEARCAVVTMGSRMNDATDKILKEHARHEILHVVLGDLMACAYDRYTTPEQIRIENEKLVARLSRLK